MQDKNSKLPKLLSLAKLATFRSRVAAPTFKVFSSIISVKEKSFPSFITAPLTPLSLNSVLEPAPKIVILRFFFFFFSKKFFNLFLSLALY